MSRYKINRRFLWLALCAGLLLSGCGGGNVAETETPVPAASQPTAQTTSPQAQPTSPPAAQAPALPASAIASAASFAGTRSNTPELHIPEAPGEAVLGGAPLEIDVSNISQGYVMARYTGGAAKASVRITGPDGITYKYFLKFSEEYKTLPLTGGSGDYAVEAYENVQDNQYAVLYKETVQVELEDELLPFLYPNVYVEFTEDSDAVAKAREIVAPAMDDLEAVALIYHFVVENIDYDTQKAETVTTGYLPVVDETLRTGKGICFDYAALTATMLRSQNIPTKLEIGYAGEIYHSWISVYTEDTGWIDHAIEFTGDAWTRMDPTFAAGNDNSTAILQYIGDGSHYTLQYSH